VLIDSKGKLFGKVSLVDILIVLMILGVAAGVGYKFTKSGTSSVFAKKDAVKITFFCEEAGGYVPDQIKPGDMVTDNQTGSYFGKVVSVKGDKSNTFGFNDKGESVMSAKQNYVSITLEVEGEGVYRDGINGQGISFDNINFYTYKSVELKVGNTTFWAKIKNLEKKG